MDETRQGENEILQIIRAKSAPGFEFAEKNGGGDCAEHCGGNATSFNQNQRRQTNLEPGNLGDDSGKATREKRQGKSNQNHQRLEISGKNKTRRTAAGRDFKGNQVDYLIFSLHH